MVTRDPSRRDAGTPRATTPLPTSPGRAGAPPSNAGEQLQRQAGQAVDQAQETAGQLKEQAVAQATTRLDEQREQAAGGLQSVAHAFRQTGQHLREGNQGAIAGYVEQAAERLETVTGYVSKRDVNQLLGDVARFARREPALFLGGAFTLGLFGARFLKSSTPPAPPAPPRPMRDAGTMATPPVAPPAARPHPGAAGLGASDLGTRSGSERDVIVGGPPITDAIVGSPPRDRPRTGPTTPDTTPAGGSATTPPATGRPAPTPRGSGDAGA